MKKTVSLLLVLAVLLAALPSKQASAKVPSGYTSKVDYDNNDTTRYKIDIDLVNQVITVYEKGRTGLYDTVVLQGLCTTGNKENPTGTGTFGLGHLKERFGYFVAFGQYAQYWTQIVRGIYIHSVMYDAKNITTMSKSAYNRLGEALSHGCVRVMPEHAQWIFYNCPPGTTCVIAKNRAKDAALVKALKAAKPSYSNYVQPADYKADPPIVSAAAKLGNVPVRTGFSSTRDSTLETLAQNAPLRVLQLGPDWCKVQTPKGKLGYVQTKYLAMDPDATLSVHGAYYAAQATCLYQAPSTNAATLYTYAPAQEVQVIGTVDKYWLSAKAGDTFGYVRVKHLVTKKPDITAPVTSGDNASIKAGIIANMRSGPSTSYPVIAELAAGTPVRLMEIVGSWYVVVVNGQEGYLSKICIA